MFCFGVLGWGSCVVFLGVGGFFCLFFSLLVAFFVLFFGQWGLLLLWGFDVFDRSWPASLKVLEIWEKREERTDK